MITKRPTRNVSGVLLLNKDLGLSSNRALQQVKRLFQANKAGHTGSLDPLASGVLPICFGEATKFSRFLLDADKTYIATAKLGITTTTADAEGAAVAVRAVPDFTTQQIQQVITGFIGASQQVPSMYSALKHNGQPLYKLAREGIEIERSARDIFIYEYILLNKTADTLCFQIKCSKGTYIRNLIEDLGEKLGCGAHVVQLQRIQAGEFHLANSYTLAQLQEIDDLNKLDSLLLPVTSTVQQWPQVVLPEQDAALMRSGRAVLAPAGITQGWVCMLDQTQQFLGMGEALNDGMIVARRLVSTKF